MGIETALLAATIGSLGLGAYNAVDARNQRKDAQAAQDAAKVAPGTQEGKLPVDSANRDAKALEKIGARPSGSGTLLTGAGQGPLGRTTLLGG